MTEMAVIFQGPINFVTEDMVKELSSYGRLVFSTWLPQDEDSKNKIKILEENDIRVCTNPPPSCAGIKNRYLQAQSCINGLDYCQEQGWLNGEDSRVVKFRSELFVTRDCLDRIKSILGEKEKLSSFAYVDHKGGYIHDFVISGKPEDFRYFFDLNQDKNNRTSPEIHFLQNYFRLKEPEVMDDPEWRSYEVLSRYFYFFLDDFNKNNIQIRSLKRKYECISSLLRGGGMRV